MKAMKPHPNKCKSKGFIDSQIPIHELLERTLTFSQELLLRVKPRILTASWPFPKPVYLFLTVLSHFLFHRPLLFISLGTY